jgi:hypothetical protein
MPHIASCPECRKKYKVPHLEKEWRCKTCKVALELPEDPVVSSGPSSKSGPSATCPACGAPTATSAGSCAECGEVLHKRSSVQARNPVLSKQQADQDSRLNSKVRMAARKKLKQLVVVRVVVVLALILHVLAFVSQASGLMASAELGSDAASLFGTTVVLWLLWSAHNELKSVHGDALPHVRGLAMINSFYALLLFFTDLKYIFVALALLFWYSVSVLSQIRTWKAEHPGAFGNMSRQGSDGGGSAPTRRQVAEERNATAAGKKRTIIFLVVLTMLTLGAAAGRYIYLPPKPINRMHSFVDVWNEGDFKGVASFAAPENQAKWVQRLERRKRILDWEGHPPELIGITYGTLRGGMTLAKPPTVDVVSGAIRVRFSTQSGWLDGSFILIDRDWVLRSLDYTHLE